MADDWEDWEDEVELKLPAAAPAAAAAVKDVDESKFAGEDEGEEEPAWKASVPKPEQSKKQPKRYEDRGAAAADEAPLDDPIAEKLRQQRLVEESDFRNAQELFGSDKTLDSLAPKSAKEFEEYGRLLAAKYLLAHSRSPQYKSLLKAVLKAALGPLPVQETKDLETTVAGIRADKVKAETAEKAAKAKAGKKKSVNVGSKGGTAGLDDYQYDAPLDDDYDFM